MLPGYLWIYIIYFTYKIEVSMRHWSLVSTGWYVHYLQYNVPRCFWISHIECVFPVIVRIKFVMSSDFVMIPHNELPQNIYLHFQTRLDTWFFSAEKVLLDCHQYLSFIEGDTMKYDNSGNNWYCFNFWFQIITK